VKVERKVFKRTIQPKFPIAKISMGISE